MNRAIIILAALLAAAFTAAPAMTGGIDQLSIYERSVKGGSINPPKNTKNTNSKKNHFSKTSKNSANEAQRRAAARRAAARKTAAKRAAAKRAAAKQAAAQQAAARSATGAAKAKTTDEPTAAKPTTDSDSQKSAPVKASAIAATNTLKFRPEPPPEKTDNDAASTETAGAGGEPSECKRYIPSAGMTVSVPCGPDP